MITAGPSTRSIGWLQDAVARGAALCAAAGASRDGLLLSSDRALRRAGRRRDGAGGNLRSGGADLALRTGDEAIARANDTEYGLAAYIFTRDLARGMRVAAKIEAGMIALNRGLVSDPAAPFGGVKQSGIGREGGQGHGIAEFMEAKYLAVAM